MEDQVQERPVAGRADAETIALKVLDFIVGDLDRIIQFLNVTGLQPETIRDSAQSPLFLLGVLDYVSKDEELLKEIDRQLDIRPASILVAAVLLTPAPEAASIDRKPEPKGPQVMRRRLFK